MISNVDRIMKQYRMLGKSGNKDKSNHAALPPGKAKKKMSRWQTNNGRRRQIRRRQLRSQVRQVKRMQMEVQRCVHQVQQASLLVPTPGPTPRPTPAPTPIASSIGGSSGRNNTVGTVEVHNDNDMSIDDIGSDIGSDNDADGHSSGVASNDGDGDNNDGYGYESNNNDGYESDSNSNDGYESDGLEDLLGPDDNFELRRWVAQGEQIVAISRRCDLVESGSGDGKLILKRGVDTSKGTGTLGVFIKGCRSHKKNNKLLDKLEEALLEIDENFFTVTKKMSNPFPGTYKAKGEGRWSAKSQLHGKVYFLGTVDDRRVASRVYVLFIEKTHQLKKDDPNYKEKIETAKTEANVEALNGD